jgi:endo-1,4-beta-xylanase
MAKAAIDGAEVARTTAVWADEPIRRTRTAQATVALTRQGRPLANRPVTVAQKRHSFLFASIGFEFVPLANGEVEGAERERMELLEREWLELFNFATLPFYWGRFEPVRGKPDTARLLAAARWFRERGIPCKGHPLLWHTTQPDWLLELSNQEVVEAQRARVRREVSDFRGLIDAWDAVNEAVIMPVYDRKENGITRICRANGRVATIRLAFETARESNPNAFLVLNDFDMSTAYECLVEAVLEAGIKVDALGLQSHMHQGYWGEERTLDVVDRFSRYGLPIHFTETTLVSGELMPPEIDDLNDYQVTSWPSTEDGEARQAEEAVSFYKTLLSQPAVKDITWWNLPDGGWLHAPGGLVRADGTPKPAYEALKSLIKGEWWLAPTEMVTDEAGRIEFEGWLGEYEVTAEGGGAGLTLTAPGPVSLDVALPG